MAGPDQYPHKLGESTLDQHHALKKIKDLILSYYRNFRLRVTSGNINSNCHQHVKGVLTGCPISAPVSARAMDMVLKAAEKEFRGHLSKSGVRHPPIRAFMDDLSVTTASAPGGRWIVYSLGKLRSRAWMSFKPAESRATMWKREKVADKVLFGAGV